MRAAPVLATALGAAGAALGLAGALGVTWALRVPGVVPLGGLELAMDPLAGLFLAVIGFSVAAASTYAIGHDGEARGGAYLAFVVGLGLVPLAANALTFLMAWEAMSVASWLLVLGRRDDGPARRAAWVYAVMTHAGLACLLAGMLTLWAHTGSLRFADWGAAAPALSPGIRTAAWLLLGLGFAGKAGAVPLHVWLPLAHPAAPSHVSALMSGAMIKLGVYGLLRTGFEWLGVPPLGWGAAVVAVGAVSAVVGILCALVDRDLKRLLAFSSVENVGVILIGVGSAMLFHRGGQEPIAVVALVAALYHTVNHAMFKGLLFLAAGAVVHATGTRNMEAHGGLIKAMPWTAACFLAGAMAIAGLPPLNGFVSEWLTFQALLQSFGPGEAALNLVLVLALAALALTAGLSAACFVKAFGITFLALPRSDAAAAARDAGPAARAGMLAFGAACVLLGLGPTLVIPALARVAGPLVGAAQAPAWGDLATLSLTGGFARLSTVATAAALAFGIAVPFALLALAGAARQPRRYETWGCGRLLQTARMEYTATAFAEPFTRVFRFFYRPERRVELDVHPASRFFVRRIAYANPARSLIEETLYRPALAAVHAAVARVRLLQSGSATAYLAYIFVALLLLLVLR